MHCIWQHSNVIFFCILTIFIFYECECMVPCSYHLLLLLMIVITFDSKNTIR